MPEKSPYSLKSIQEELNVKALIHLERQEGIMGKTGSESVINALVKSNLMAVLDSEIAMPIRLSANHEIYEMVLQNNRGIVAKEGRSNRYLVALKVDSDNVLAAIGDDLDPGLALFEMMRFSLQ
ncbi:MAG: hypothetical protein ACXAC2_24025 [Candidatus Kariarchaeaceae archaeon]|jgi:hypothetical protein